MARSALRYKIITTPEARSDLRELRDYIALHSTRRTAAGYIDRLKKFSASLSLAPVRGQSVDDFRPGLRRIGFEERVSVIFAVFEQDKQVEIQGYDYAGRQRKW